MEQMTAQLFMTQNRITKCYECDGQFFKHKENAVGRSKMPNVKDAEVKEHEINAGPVTTNSTPQ